MELRFRVFAHISKPVDEVFEAVADPSMLSSYFTTGGASGRIEEGATVQWSFHDFPGSFPVRVLEVVPGKRIVLEWDSNDADKEAPKYTTVTMQFTAVEGGRTLVEITEEGWRGTPSGLKASYENCMGWSQMLDALKVWVEHGINLREFMYR